MPAPFELLTDVHCNGRVLSTGNTCSGVPLIVEVFSCYECIIGKLLLFCKT